MGKLKRLKKVRKESREDMQRLQINTVYNMDCLEGLKKLPDNSVDAIVTDPPYDLTSVVKRFGKTSLADKTQTSEDCREGKTPFARTAKGFMGQEWDGTGIAFNVELWMECYRVLKPGGYLLSFGGTRTYHRMTCAIEDAGFEIRDCIMWLYGTGFPKSQDISKYIDKKFGAKREVVGHGQKGRNLTRNGIKGDMLIDSWHQEPIAPEITAPATDEAKQWEGWGSSLKPAHEDIILARKPVTVDDVCRDIIVEMITWLRFIACVVEKNFVLKIQDLKEELSIVQWIAGESINSQEDLNAVMDILQLKLKMENIDLNTILLWRNTLEDVYYLMSKYTIETKLGMITDWKTSNFIPSVAIPNIMPKGKTQQNGQMLFVLNVENRLLDVMGKLKNILPVFVQGNAMLLENERESASSEPIVMARKPLSEKTIVDNVLKWGTGGINIGGCRIETGDNLNGGAYSGGQRKDGDWKEKSGFKNDKLTGNYKQPEGRFPANVILDEEAGKMLDLQSNASRFFYCPKAGKSEREDIITWDEGELKLLIAELNLQVKAIYDIMTEIQKDQEWNMTLFGKLITDQFQKDTMCITLTEIKLTILLKILNSLTNSPTKESIRDALEMTKEYGINLAESVEKLNELTQSITNERMVYLLGVVNAVLKTLLLISEKGKLIAHATVKPIALISYLVRMITPPNGVVLDPFMGSGTTALACIKEGKNYIGFEMSKEYHEIIEKRIASL